jgi:hypothetical protein
LGLIGLFAGIWAVGVAIVLWGVVTYMSAIAKRTAHEREIPDAESNGDTGQESRTGMTRNDS